MWTYAATSQRNIHTHTHAHTHTQTHTHTHTQTYTHTHTHTQHVVTHTHKHTHTHTHTTQHSPREIPIYSGNTPTQIFPSILLCFPTKKGAGRHHRATGGNRCEEGCRRSCRAARRLFRSRSAYAGVCVRVCVYIYQLAVSVCVYIDIHIYQLYVSFSGRMLDL